MNTRFTLSNDRQKLGGLLAAVAFVVAPHALNLAPMVVAYFYLMALWHFASLYLNVRQPDKALLFVLTLTGAGIVLGHYHRIWGQEAGTSLFIVGLGLKLLETRTQRDAYLVVFLAFFVALTQYLFSQSIPMAAYTLIAVTLLVTAMIGLNSNAAFPVKARLNMAAVMVLQSLPAMMLLFVLFPRIQGPLWELPDDSHAAKTGLSDSISLGSFKSLALSHETAFRVDFAGDIPPPNLRYWRGPVFWHTNGSIWSLLPTNPMIEKNRPVLEGGFYTYTITLEPHQQRWAIALELPDSIPQGFEETSDYQLLAKSEITERIQYRLSSGTAYKALALSNSEAKKALQLPAKVGKQLTELVNGWQQGNPKPQDLVNKALRYFREQPFFYTLNPPPLGSNPVESFIFETRRGFCEHFATSFVILMRIGGVPARVVTGYQGGQWNSLGKFLEVKQADAHAWAEVWLPDTGWTRVDPTAAVAPERIEHGVDVETQVAFGEIRFNLGDGLAARHGFGLMNIMNRLSMIASSIDYAWDSWVLAYGTENQARLFEWMGIVDWQMIAVWLSNGLILFLLAMAWFILPKRHINNDPAKRIYNKFLEKLATHGLRPKTGEGPVKFADTIGKRMPELTETAKTITQLYLRIRYEQFHGANDLKTLKALVHRLPKKRRFGL